MSKIKISSKGFTLIELLVVVLIIGILSAVALPMYRKAVEKSRVTDALNTMQAVAKSEHGWYLMNNGYTKDFANLDIALTDKDGNKAAGEDFESPNYTYELLDRGIIADRNNGEYTLYKDYETGEVFCAPLTNQICDEYSKLKAYLPKGVCEDLGGAYHSTSSSCYQGKKEMCEGLNKPWNDEGDKSFCGYKDDFKPTLDEGIICRGETYEGNEYNSTSCKQATINYGGICEGIADYSCFRPFVNEGGLCISQGLHACTYATVDGGTCRGVCQGSTLKNGGTCEGGSKACYMVTVDNNGICKGGCQYVTIKDGGICIGDCNAPKVKDGGICYAGLSNASCGSYAGATSGANLSTYEGSGCCCGSACSGRTATVNGVANQPVPICPESKCDPKYMK